MLGRILVAVIVIGLAACTQQGRYNAAQDLAVQQAGCDKLPTADEAYRCKQENTQSYEDYQREREELLKDQK